MRKFISVIIAGGFIAVFAGAAYSAEHDHGMTHEKTIKSPESSPGAARADTQAVNAGNKICPVSGEKIDAAAMKPATYEYKGKIYNFCCEMCIDEFKKDPEKYIKKVEEELHGENT